MKNAFLTLTYGGVNMNRSDNIRKSEENYLYKIGIKSLPNPGETYEGLIKDKLNTLSKGDNAAQKGIDLKAVQEVLGNKEELIKEINFFETYLEETLEPTIKLIVEIANYGEIDEDNLDALINKKKELKPHKTYILNKLKKEGIDVFKYEDKLKFNNFKNIDTIIQTNELIVKAVSQNLDFENSLGSNLNASQYDIYYFYSTKFPDTNQRVYTKADSLKTLQDRHKEVDNHFRIFNRAGKNEKYKILEEIKKQANNILLNKELFEDYNKVSSLTHLNNKIKKLVRFNMPEYLSFVKEAKTLTNDDKFAEYFVKYLYKKAKIEVIEQDKQKQLDVCKNCGNLYDIQKYKEKCPHCNISFVEKCLVCGQTHNNLKCPRCLMSNDDYRNFEKVLSEANKAANILTDYKEAKRLLNSINISNINALDKYKKIGNYHQLSEQVEFETYYLNIKQMIEKGGNNSKDIEKGLNSLKVSFLKLIKNNSNINSRIKELEVLYKKLKNSIQCPNCKTLISDHQATKCSNPSCGISFIEVCWNCNKKRNLLLNTKCSCEATNAIENNLKKDINEIYANIERTKAEKYSFDLLETDLNTFTKKYQNINKPDTKINKILAKTNSKIRLMSVENTNRKKEINKAKEEINNLYKNKKLVSAIEHINKLITKYPELNNDDLFKNILVKYNNVLRIINELKYFQNINSKSILEVPEQLNKLENIINECSDCNGINDLLSNLKVTPIKNLSYSVKNNLVTLKFYSSSSLNANYEVVSKIGSASTGINDYTNKYPKIAVTNFTLQQLPAVSYYYDVYAKSYGRTSTPVTIGPIEIFPNINEESIKQIEEEGVISVVFQQPINVLKINVYREDYQSNSKNKVIIEVNNLNSFKDNDVILGREYIYTFETVYLFEGKEVVSNKLTKSFIPMSIPPELVISSVDKIDDSSFNINYNKVDEEQNNISFYYSNGLFNIDRKKIYTKQEINSLISDNQLRSIIYNNKNNKFEVNHKHEILYITGIITKNGYSKVSNTYIYNNNLGIESFIVKTYNNNFKIEFKFLKNSLRSFVFVNNSKFIEKFDNKLNYRKIDNKNTHVSEMFDFDQSDAYISVFTEVKIDNNIMEPNLSKKIYINKNKNENNYYKTDIKNKKIKVEIFAGEQFIDKPLYFELLNNDRLIDEYYINNLKFKWDKKSYMYKCNTTINFKKNNSINKLRCYFKKNDEMISLIEG